jgi:hypothetical protein
MRQITARRLLAAAALATALFAGAACTDDTNGSGSGNSDPTVTTSAETSGTGSSGTGSGSGGTGTASDKQVCTDTEKLIGDSTQKFAEEILKGAQAGSEQAALSAVKTLFAEWASGLRTQAGKAANPELKNALLQYATGLETVNSRVNSYADLQKLDELNTPEIETATEKISQLCG